MADIAIFRINYKSDFILTLQSDAGWATPFCIKFWTGAPSQAYYAGYDGETYTHCAVDGSDPTKLAVQFDDYHLPIGDLKFQIGYHFTVADFPTAVEDEVINQAAVIIDQDGTPMQVMLDFQGETAPEIEFSLPAYANEAQRIANEQQRIADEQERIENEQQRIADEETRQAQEARRIAQEAARVSEFATLKSQSQAATSAANTAAALANEKAQLAADKAALAQQKADYAQTQGDYAKEQGDTALADHERAEADHAAAAADHTTAQADHAQAATDHTTAAADHTTAQADHAQAVSDHAAVEPFADSLGAYDISSAHASGGVMATYADLTDALGTNGANIPEGIRKGGMSVKFVQSSDSKYVSYRLMSQTFSTTVTDWQGVDDVPTAGSDNLVKSGGVYEQFNELDIELFGREQQSIDLTQLELHPGVIDKNTSVWAVVTNVKYKHIVLPVNPGEKYTITYNGSKYPVWGFFKTYTEPTANGQTPDWCSGYGSAIGENTTSSILNIPSDCHFLYLTALSGNADFLPSTMVMAAVEGRLSAAEELLEQHDSAIEENAQDISDMDDVLDDVTDTLQLTPASTVELDASEANSYYLNHNYEELVASDTKKITNPTYLKVGDAVRVISPAMDWSSGNTVVGKASGSNLLTAQFQSIQIVPTGTGYDTTYSYTVTEDGYYVIGWSANYSQAHAYIDYAAHSQVSDLNSRVNKCSSDIEKIEGWQIGTAINVFGEVLPQDFRDKYFGGEDDVEIVCVGDSLTGLINYCDELEDAEHLPAGMTHKHWTYLLWNRICLNKPVCDRLDSQRSGSDVFTKTGTWNVADFGSSNSSGDYGEYSIAANTYKSTDLNAAVAFSFDASSFEKLNIVFSKEPDGCETAITITEGDGKLLASLDKVNYVEANGFAISQSTTSMRERHCRVWLKKASGVTGLINVSIQRTDSDNSKAMYVWGTEKWNGASLFLTNLGRGGRNISLLRTNISDVFDRNPDICMLELPLANETVTGAKTLSVLKGDYSNYVSDFATASSNYTDVELLVVLPHGRAGYFDGNQAIIMQSTGTVDMINHLKCKAIYNYIRGLVASHSEHVGLVDLMEQLYNDGLNRDYTINGWLSPSTLSLPSLTHDGIHLNTFGSKFWCKYLCPLFQ